MNPQLITPEGSGSPQAIRPTLGNSPLPILHCHFALPLQHAELSAFRGAFAEFAGHGNEWFHNHDNVSGNFHYRYPLVQYQVVEGHAAITALGEGARALEQVMGHYDGRLWMRGQWHAAACTVANPGPFVPQTTETWQTYQIRDWVALNEKNHNQWRNTGRLADQMAVLETAFTSHVMAFARGIGWFVDKRLVAQLIDYQGCQWHQRRGANLLAFDATFRVQAQLPEGVGLGKGVSIGFGRLGRF